MKFVIQDKCLLPSGSEIDTGKILTIHTCIYACLRMNKVSSTDHLLFEHPNCSTFVSLQNYLNEIVGLRSENLNVTVNAGSCL